MRAKANVDQLAAEVRQNLRIIEASIDPTPESEAAFANLETFVAVSLRLMAKTNPSKLRDVTYTEWIKGLMDGKPEVEPPSK